MPQNYENLTKVRNQFRGNSTQAESLHEVSQSGLRRSQKLLVLEIIQSQGPICMRWIALKGKMELTAVCRSIKDLEINEPRLVRIAFVAKSSITGKKVQHYVDRNWISKVGLQIDLL